MSDSQLRLSQCFEATELCIGTQNTGLKCRHAFSFITKVPMPCIEVESMCALQAVLVLRRNGTCINA